MYGFQTIPGQSAVKMHFQSAVRNDRVSHAYMLIGERGMGKRKLADAFAALLLCEENGSEPCGRCHACRQVQAGTHPDLIHITHEKKTISVDEIRAQLSEEAVIRPFSGKKKIFIIPDAEKMTVQAQNAALKTIEEPPAYAVILLLTESEEALLDTIKSRCVRLRLRPAADSEIRELLKKNENTDPDAIDLAVSFSGGNPGRAEDMLSDPEFRAKCEEVFGMLKNVREANAARLMKYTGRIRELYPELTEFLDFLRIYYRDVLLIKTEKRPEMLMFPAEESAMMREAREIGIRQAGIILDEIEKTEQRLRANVNPDLALELLFLTMKGNDT